jgi:hypothetical protein
MAPATSPFTPRTPRPRPQHNRFSAATPTMNVCILSCSNAHGGSINMILLFYYNISSVLIYMTLALKRILASYIKKKD